ncbi:MAG: aminotransferase class V-fold PLP-dependent enzyme, partial [Bifidobacteriaceae bacterium]|nr:aminotransferase class V-fold PLP-dependent enzyme [Bifidobacteriaceae bacterium]
MTGSSPLSETAAEAAAPPFSAESLAAVRADFPELGRRLDGTPLVYLDSAATALRPRAVIDAMRDFSERRVAAVHRGAHQLAAQATEAFEDARARIAAFVGAAPSELVFASGTTGAVNMLVASLTAASVEGAGAARFALKPGDRIVVTQGEHHSNLVPWQRLARLTGAELAWLPVDAEGRVDVAYLPDAVRERTR